MTSGAWWHDVVQVDPSYGSSAFRNVRPVHAVLDAMDGTRTHLEPCAVHGAGDGQFPVVDSRETTVHELRQEQLPTSNPACAQRGAVR